MFFLLHEIEQASGVPTKEGKKPKKKPHGEKLRPFLVTGDS
jgi:hypothetical protein